LSRRPTSPSVIVDITVLKLVSHSTTSMKTAPTTPTRTLFGRTALVIDAFTRHFSRREAYVKKTSKKKVKSAKKKGGY
jgi:hypothetical protein